MVSGSAGSLDLLEVWICWKSGSAGSLDLLEVWICWKSGSAGSLDLLEVWICWKLCDDGRRTCQWVYATRHAPLCSMSIRKRPVGYASTQCGHPDYETCANARDETRPMATCAAGVAAP